MQCLGVCVCRTVSAYIVSDNASSDANGFMYTLHLLAVGNVPLVWYKDEDHIGYDLDGKAIAKSKKKDQLDKLLDRNDSKQVSGW